MKSSSIFFCLVFEKISWHFMWIFNLVARDSHEMSKNKWRYPGNATVVKHSFPEAPQVGKMRNKMASVAQSHVPLTGDQKVTGLIPARSCNILFLDWTWNHCYSHSLPSVESRRQLSVSGKRICLFTRESIQKTNIAKCSNTAVIYDQYAEHSKWVLQ